MWSQSKMPIFGFADQDIEDMVSFMTREYIDLDLDEKEAARQIQLVKNASSQRGRELADKQGCVGCHSKIQTIKELGETRPGPFNIRCGSYQPPGFRRYKSPVQGSNRTQLDL